MGSAKNTPYYDHEPVYSRLARTGRQSWDDDDHAFDQLRAFLKSAHAPRPGLALDLGCGGGQAAMLLAHRGWSVLATDYSQTAVRMALENIRETNQAIYPFVADAARPLPVRPGSIDLVVDNHVLHCFVSEADRKAFLNNAYTALRPGGIFFSTNMSCEGGLDFEALQIDPATRIGAHGRRYFASRDEFEHEFTEAGFDLPHVAFVPDEQDPRQGHDAVIYARRP